MFTRRCSTLAALAAAYLLVPAVPAHALVAPQMSVTASRTTTTITVCGDGQLRGGTAVEPTWRMDSISTGGLVPVQQHWETRGRTFHHCFTGPLTANSTVSAVLTYTGVGDDYPSTVFGYGTYVNGRYDEFEMTQ